MSETTQKQPIKSEEKSFKLSSALRKNLQRRKSVKKTGKEEQKD